MRRIRNIVVLVLVVAPLLGTTYAQLSVSELFAASDFVALVQVERAEVLRSGENYCGALYTGLVVEQFKGGHQPFILFGHDGGLRFGAEYLVFLSDPNRVHRSLNSTNSISEKARSEQLAKCAKNQTGWNIMHSGIAALLLFYAEAFDYAPAFAVPTRYVKFPDNLAETPATIGLGTEFTEMRWLKKDEVLEVMRSLGTVKSE